jgi:hypothetical protein
MEDLFKKIQTIFLDLSDLFFQEIPKSLKIEKYHICLPNDSLLLTKIIRNASNENRDRKAIPGMPTIKIRPLHTV